MAYCLNPNCPQLPSENADPASDPEQFSLAKNSPTKEDPHGKFCQRCGVPLVLKAKGEQYRLVSLLGQGSFGRTFLAERLPSHAHRATETCIIKQIYRQPVAGDADFSAENFSAEVERLRRLGEHPQIPTLIAAVETELGQFLVQAYIPGNTLAEQVEMEGTWTEMQVRSLLKSLIPVLQYIHSFDVIHRDIKPANVILASDKNQLPVLVDFGAAKQIRYNPAQTVIGSASYAAPEQSMGKATFASDIYSLGLTCLHALTGIHPFTLYSTAEDRWVWQDYLPQPVEPRFAQLLDHMVATPLQQRYESIDQVALDFQFSRNLLLHAPKQLFNRAMRSAAPLTGAFQAKTQVSPRSPRENSDPVGQRLKQSPHRQIWKRQHLITQPVGLTGAIALSPAVQPTGRVFATAGTEGTLRLWHLPSAQLIHTFPRRRLMGEGHTASVSALEFHPDGRALYSASADGSIKEWDTAERQLLNTLPGAGWNPTALALSEDGTRLVSAYSDGQMVVWNVQTLASLARLVQHQKQVSAIAISPKGQLLASASDDGTLKLWRWPSDGMPQLFKTIRLEKQTYRHPQRMFGDKKLQPPQWAQSLKSQSQQWARDVKAIAVGLYTPGLQTAGEQASPSGVKSSGYAHQLLVATSAHQVLSYLIDEHTMPGLPTTLYQATAPITAFSLSKTGLLAVGSEDATVTLWDVNTAERVAELGHDWSLTAADISADGQMLITASADETISVWQRDE